MKSFDKNRLRQHLAARRRGMPDAVRHDYSQAIMQYVHVFLHQKQARYVLAYRSMGSEVETTSLHTEADQTFAVYAPVCGEAMGMIWYSSHHNTWKTAKHGILEPQGGELWRGNEPDTWLLCPLLGFDRCGHRIGMGKGYFDRWLACYRDAVVGVVGLAFAEQEVNRIPIERHDQPLDCMITEKGNLCLNL